MSFTFQIPDRAVMKGPNFIRKVFERGAGIPGLSVLASEIPLRKLFL